MRRKHQGDTRADEDVLLPLGAQGTDRRSFLRLVGFGITAATLSGCSRGPARKVVTWMQAPEGIVAGRGYSIATTCAGCSAGCGLLAHCKDGRPVKLEGNPGHPVSGGGLCAVGQADILALYDSHRLDGPRDGGKTVTWKQADEGIAAALQAAKQGGRLRMLSGTITSPSTLAVLEGFLGGFGDARHVMYDALSCSAILDAHEATHGRRALPHYRFGAADVIASFDADFLGTWISPVEFARGYAPRRDPEREEGMSRHWQIEARMSLTGGCADERVRLAPWEQGPALATLSRLLARKAGREVPSAVREVGARDGEIARLAEDLWAARGRSLVVCGANDAATQSHVNLCNELLGNYGRTLDVARPSLQKRGDDRALETLKEELEAGSVDVLLVQGCDPAADLPGMAAAISKAKLVISFAPVMDATAALARWVCPEPHALESWNDGQPRAGVFTLTQPTVPALRSARTMRGSLARWSGERRGDRDLIREHWKRSVQGICAAPGTSFDRFFHQALHDGSAVERVAPAAPTPAFRMQGVREPGAGSAPAAGSLGLVLYAKVSMLDGRHAWNPWLQELPDPVSRITWESYATLSTRAAARLDVSEGDVIRLKAGEGLPDLELPVHIQPGQHDGIVAVALGYGRRGTDRFSAVGPEWWEGESTVEPGGRIGVNAAPLLALASGQLRYVGRSVGVTPTGDGHELASVQEHHSLEVPEHLAPAHGEVRDAVRSATLAAFREDPQRAVHGEHEHPRVELWPDDHAPEGHHWGLAIDLNACTGCGACVVACQAENNVPVVGRDEVRRHREMSWLRIDRYHVGEDDDVEVAHQPMMCQHCDHAPCEAVCPVLATVHSSEGLNQQVYNRCVGTRYCANTCPYKVRRFNWFDYPHEDRLQNLSLNPDVTVRSRGVMEKCTMCVQRIQEARIDARRRGVPLKDGDIQVACQQTCPTQAIRFGDQADGESGLSKRLQGNRAYRVLEETNVRPSVGYLARIRNRKV